MEDKRNLKKLIGTSEIEISKNGKNLYWNSLQKMKGEELLEYDVQMRGHKVEFFKGSIPNGLALRAPKEGIGYHYRNVGTCASKENSSAIELIESAYGTSLCWDAQDRLRI